MGREAIGPAFRGESYAPAELTQRLVAEGRLSGRLEDMLAQDKGSPDALTAIAGDLWRYGPPCGRGRGLSIFGGTNGRVSVLRL